MSIRSATQKDKLIQKFYDEMTDYWDLLASWSHQICNY